MIEKFSCSKTENREAIGNGNPEAKKLCMRVRAVENVMKARDL
jgi:hypothetical protein